MLPAHAGSCPSDRRDSRGAFGKKVDGHAERARLANFSDLDARRRSGLLRGLMFLHMKAGLNAGMIRLRDTTETSKSR